MPIANSLLAEFRRRIKDVRPSTRAFGLAIVDPTVTGATAEVTAGHLIITVIGGNGTPSLDLDLSNPRYDTVGRLYQLLSRAPGYRCTRDEDGDEDHASIDLEPFGPLSIQGTGVDMNHHNFADSELEEVLKSAIARHNPSLTLVTLPPQEYAFVMPLAQANICRIQAFDASKRKGMDRDVSSLIALADSFEKQYTTDTSRLTRALQSPQGANPNTVGEGDAMLGTQYRRSLRTGFMSPLGAVSSPDAPILLDPDEHDIEDDNVRVVWQRNKQEDFYSYELWQDSREDVQRCREGQLIFSGPFGFVGGPGPGPGGDQISNEARRATTSRMVFRSFGPNANSSQSSFATFVEEFGQLIRSFAVGMLESNSDYYWRLFIVNLNYVVASSNVVHARTKMLRCRFMPANSNPLNPGAPYGSYINVTSGPPGTVVTLTLDPSRAAFQNPGYTLKIGNMAVVPTISGGGYTLSMTVPTFENYGPKDLAIISPNQLVSVRHGAFTVTSS
jgi:hypothetical protein